VTTLPGSTMPGGFQIKPAKLRGEESLGMMLSERELELSTEHDGIMILPAEWTPGAPLAEHVPLGDTVIELEITPNRPDCLGVFGVARELERTPADPAAASPRNPLPDIRAAVSDECVGILRRREMFGIDHQNRWAA